MTGTVSRSLLNVFLAASLMVVGSACGDDGSTEDSGGGTITTTEEDFKIRIKPSTASSGSVTFEIHNNGPSTHEFVVFKTDLAPDKLPLDTSEGIVDESGTGLTSVHEQEDIEKDTDATLTVNLDAGSYVVICNLAGHYQQGMRARLTVS